MAQWTAGMTLGDSKKAAQAQVGVKCRGHWALTSETQRFVQRPRIGRPAGAINRPPRTTRSSRSSTFDPLSLRQAWAAAHILSASTCEGCSAMPTDPKASIRDRARGRIWPRIWRAAITAIWAGRRRTPSAGGRPRLVAAAIELNALVGAVDVERRPGLELTPVAILR